MVERFVDYFEVGGLDPNASRAVNYEAIVKAHRIAATKQGRRGKTDEFLLNEAMEIFKDPDKYEEYRELWEQRRQKPPDAEPDSKSDTDEPERAAIPEGGFWSALGSVAVKGIEAYLENKRSVGAGHAEEQRRPALRADTLTGTWRDAMGNPFHVQQNGRMIAVQGTDAYGNVVVEGRGTLSGRTIQYEARNAGGQTGRGVFTVSRDGHVIDGQISWWQFNMPAGMFHVRLVRS